MILANPNKWFPWVDQVDRPYFIAIDKQNRVYSEFTDFDLANPITAQSNNWYEQVDKDNLKYFIIKGRFGLYYLEMDTGLFFADYQHQVGDHSIQTQIYGLKIFDTTITGTSRPYKLIHFKTSEAELMGGPKPNMRGAYCSPPIRFQKDKKTGFLRDVPVFLKPKHPSQTDRLYFGWELQMEGLGRITFEGAVMNRTPGFILRLLYSPLETISGDFAQICRFDVQGKREDHLLISGSVKAGDRFNWEQKVV